VAPAPVTLDQTRWLGLWSRLGAHEGGVEAFGTLAAAYAEPARAYHNANHIQDCLTELDRTRAQADQPDEVEAALWFHDAIYVPGASDNEDRSARLAHAVLSTAGVPPARAQRIAEFILATRHVTIPEDRDARYLCDIDLSILGRTPAEFEEYERQIRSEYGWVPEPAYRGGRSELLAGFLRRQSIFQTQTFRRRYEAQARRNLERKLAELVS
jgi:predicted metal-dependent HD superfamily phosphohydrolase